MHKSKSRWQIDTSTWLWPIVCPSQIYETIYVMLWNVVNHFASHLAANGWTSIFTGKLVRLTFFFWFFFWPSETFVMRLMTRCCAADAPLWYPPWHRSDAIRMLQKTSWRGWRIWTQTDETRWSCDVSSDPWVQASQSQWPPQLATLLWVMISRHTDIHGNYIIRGIERSTWEV